MAAWMVEVACSESEHEQAPRPCMEGVNTTTEKGHEVVWKHSKINPSALDVRQTIGVLLDAQPKEGQRKQNGHANHGIEALFEQTVIPFFGHHAHVTKKEETKKPHPLIPRTEKAFHPRLQHHFNQGEQKREYQQNTPTVHPFEDLIKEVYKATLRVLLCEVEDGNEQEGIQR